MYSNGFAEDHLSAYVFLDMYFVIISIGKICIQCCDYYHISLEFLFHMLQKVSLHILTESMIFWRSHFKNDL